MDPMNANLTGRSAVVYARLSRESDGVWYGVCVRPADPHSTLTGPGPPPAFTERTHTMSNATTSTPATSRNPLSRLNSRMRARIGAGGTLAVWTIGATALAAAAAVLFILGIRGSVTIGTAPTFTYATTGLRSEDDGSGVSCQANVTDSGKSLTLNIRNALPGSSCKFTTPVYGTSTGYVVQSLDLGTSSVIVAEDTAGAVCGKPLTASSSSPTAITWTLTIPSDASAGTITLPSSAGVSVVPSGQYSPAACKVAK